jgi:2-dehydro-3-deoxy-D-arabinonate dehydratase
MTPDVWSQWLARPPTGLALVSVLTGWGPQLCAVGDAGALFAVRDTADVADLLARSGAASLEDAVERAGVDGSPVGSLLDPALRLGPPVRPAEVWAAGVTYERSRDARILETSGAGDIYGRAYAAERPELFLKATGPRVQGPGGPVGLRSDSSWQVPEAELGLVIGRDGRIAGYVLGNDLSSRDIEGANALYLPQAKVFAGSCSLGPLVLSVSAALTVPALTIELEIARNGALAYRGEVSVGRLRRRPGELVDWLTRENWLPPGAVLLTGTGIVPGEAFSLVPGDEIRIRCGPLGTLVNFCEPAAALRPPATWWRAG